jgi:hypothetical protein
VMKGCGQRGFDPHAAFGHQVPATAAAGLLEDRGRGQVMTALQLRGGRILLRPHGNQPLDDSGAHPVSLFDLKAGIHHLN